MLLRESVLTLLLMCVGFFYYTGISSFCPQCCHGGHLFHMLDWFDKNSECPSGCGCNCSRISYVTQNSNKQLYCIIFNSSKISP